MTTQRDPMLDAEERLLAEQLARIAPRGEPSAELDARILAMAGRGSVHAPSSSARRRPKRWPVWLGVAASLTAVAGLVWRLEPILHPGQPVRYETPAPVAADTDPNGQRSPVAYVATQVAADAVPPPPPPMMSAPLPGATPKPASPAAKSMAEVAMKPAVDAASEAEAVAPEPAPAAMTAKSAVVDRDLVQEMPRRPAPTSADAAYAPAPPPAPPAPVAAERNRAVQAADAPTARIAAPAPPAAPPPPPAPTEDRAGFDARPPATADAPEVRQAWLSRIRELRDAGDTDEAKASLKAFVQRYPKADIPADLKPLLPPPSPPTPSP